MYWDTNIRRPRCMLPGSVCWYLQARNAELFIAGILDAEPRAPKFGRNAQGYQINSESVLRGDDSAQGAQGSAYGRGKRCKVSKR